MFLISFPLIGCRPLLCMLFSLCLIPQIKTKQHDFPEFCNLPKLLCNLIFALPATFVKNEFVFTVSASSPCIHTPYCDLASTNKLPQSVVFKVTSNFVCLFIYFLTEMWLIYSVQIKGSFSPWTFTEWIHLCDHTSDQDVEHFQYPRMFLCTFSQVLPFSRGNHSPKLYHHGLVLPLLNFM